MLGCTVHVGGLFWYTGAKVLFYNIIIIMAVLIYYCLIYDFIISDKIQYDIYMYIYIYWLTPGGSMAKLKKIPQSFFSSGRERSFEMAFRGVKASLTAIMIDSSICSS